MTSSTSKDYSTMSKYPKALTSIIFSVGLLAVFITFASWVLVSHPIGTVVRSYFYGVDNTSNTNLPGTLEGGNVGEVHTDGKSEMGNLDKLPKPEVVTEPAQNQNTGNSKKQDALPTDSNSGEEGMENPVASQNKDSTDERSNGDVSAGLPKPETSLGSASGKGSVDSGQLGDVSAGLPKPETSLDSSASRKGSVDSECDLYHGEWFYDPAGPLYTNNSCPVLTQMQNCQGNGRPDKEYENWRWKPSQCELPRFNASKFLELMSGKTLAFVGDSVARNQMESLLCLLWQVEVPKNRGNRHMQRWFFRSKSVTLARIWSSWLVHQTSEPFSYVPEGIAKLHLDIPDETFMELIPKFDVVVLSSGHWFAKQSIYMLNNEIVGTQLWSPPKKQQQPPTKVNNIEAFGISVETSLKAMVTHPNFTGLTIVRSFSPDHYEGGAWNTGGSCTGKTKPLKPGESVENEFTNAMHHQQVTGFDRAIKQQTNQSKLKLLDITEVFSYRHDGHPGPYRNPDPNKITKRGPDGRPPPQDCLHWCMPGPIDTWNELVLEIIRREFEGKQTSAS